MFTATNKDNTIHQFLRMYKYIFQFCVKYLQAAFDKATGQWATHDFDGFTPQSGVHSSHSQ